MKHIGSGSPITTTELKFWARIKSLYIRFKVYYLCDADESIHWSDKAIMLLLGLFVLVLMVLGLVVRVLNL